MDQPNPPYFERTLSDTIAHTSEQFPVLLLTGPRQVGKTHLFQHLSNSTNRQYVSLDDPNIAEQAKSEPKLFLELFKPPILIDEIQYAPQLFPYIKMMVDKTQTPGLFWLTGSQQFQLMKGVSESLAGRVALFNLLGFSQQEIEQNPNVPPFLPEPEQLNNRPNSRALLTLPDLFEHIWRGFFPRLYNQTQIKNNVFYSAYIKTYLQRDVRDLTLVEDETTFLRFLKAAAARTGQCLNMNDLARDADISPHTAKKWLSVLEASGIIYLLQPYFNNLTKRIVKTPKLYFLDTGLCAYLTGWSTPETLATGAFSGAILETYVISEIIKSYWHNGLDAPIYYYRDKDQKEIDLIIVKNNTLYPLEIKKTANPDIKSLRHFSVLKKLGKTIGPGGLLCLHDKLLPLADGLYSIPIYRL